MTPRQRLFRAVKWAFGLTLFTLAFVVFGFCTCPGTSATISYGEASKLLDSRPPDTAPQAEQEEWQARYRATSSGAYWASGRAFQIAAMFVGVPTVVLLIVVCVLLYRAKVWLRRGA